jgi:hypothetical protein
MNKINMLTVEELKKLVSENTSIAGILRNMGYSSVTGGLHKQLKERILKQQIDYSHFKSGGVGGNKEEIPIEKILIQNSSFHRGHLKERILKEKLLKYECAICGQPPEWNNKPLTLVIDHINGINNDDRLHNLQFLCPNCNSQTFTFCGRNVKKNATKNYCSCKKEISKGSLHCVACNNKLLRHNERPPIEIIIDQVRNIGYSATAKLYSVSDNAIRKWVKKSMQE